MFTPETHGADTAIAAIVDRLVSLTGADVTNAETIEAAGDLRAYLAADRTAGDSLTVRQSGEARPLVHTSAEFTVINDRCQLGATVWAYRGAFQWEF